MNNHHRHIANSEEFKEKAARMHVKTLARELRVSTATLYEMLHFSGIKKKVGRLTEKDYAPTPEEDLASMSSLALAPMVAKRARKVFAEHLEKRRIESEDASECGDV